MPKKMFRRRRRRIRRRRYTRIARFRKPVEECTVHCDLVKGIINPAANTGGCMIVNWSGDIRNSLG